MVHAPAESTQPGALTSKRAFVLIWIAAVLLGTVILSGNSFPDFFLRLLVDGGFCIAWLIAASGCGLALLRAFQVRLEFLLHLVIAAALGLGGLGLIVLLLGLLGAINRAGSFAMIVVGAAGFSLFIRDIWSARPRDKVFARTSWLLLLAVPAVSIALVSAHAPPGVLWGDEPNGYDVLEYHLQVPREWYESGQITPLPHNIYSYLPFNVEMHYLLAMHLRGGPWAGMYLAQLMHASFTALSIIALFAIIKPQQSAAPSRILPDIQPAIIATLAMLTAPWLFLLAPIAYNEGGLLLFGALAIGLTWRANDTRDWLLAGALAGFACAVKLTAAPMLLGAIALAALVARHAPWRSIGWFVLTGMLTFSPWLIRNAVWTNNPVFPEAMEVFGRGDFTEMQQERWRRAHAPPPPQATILNRIRAVDAQILRDWRYGYVLLPLGVAGLILARSRRARFLLITLAIMTIVWLVFTHLQSRFFVLAIPVLAIGVAEAVAARPKLRIPITAMCAIAIVAGLVRWHGQYVSPRENRPGIFTIAMSAVGLDSLEAISPIAEMNIPPDATVALVGDARAFLYPRPMSRLRYRTVFDVRFMADEPLIEAWLGPDVPTNAVMIVDPGELRRFSNPMTGYYGITSPPPDVAARDRPFIMPR